MPISEGPGHVVVKYADGKPQRLPRRSATFSYEFDGFHGSDEFLVIELSGSFDCVFGIPWLARHQPHIDWLTRTVRPRDIDVNAVLASLSGTPNNWPHVEVMDPDSMTTAVCEVSDGPSCAACVRATCVGPELESQDMIDAIEQGLSRHCEQWLPKREEDVVERGLPRAVEQGFPRVVEQELPDPEQEDVVERGLPRAVEQRLP
ncbi:Polyprotein [Phytophthora palmivora]|uniref:Polyprotein n=1 Tax=Phytophthora palmivora TaxID=4796 RepID=A0A2P4XMM6_9STRA|nr:Polyprotein [Phytophthora palmivora]